MSNFIGQLQGGFNALLGAAAGYKMAKDKKAYREERDRVRDEQTNRKLDIAESKAETAKGSLELKNKQFEFKKERAPIEDEQKNRMLAIREQNAKRDFEKEGRLQRTEEATKAKLFGQATKDTATAKLTEEHARKLGIENTLSESTMTTAKQRRNAENKAAAYAAKNMSQSQAAYDKSLAEQTEITERSRMQKMSLQDRLRYVSDKGGPEAVMEYMSIANAHKGDDEKDLDAAMEVIKKYGGKK